MAYASARRSFHAPIHYSLPVPRRPRAPVPPRPLELVPTPPSASALARALLEAARDEAPSTCERERMLASVLSALQLLTRAKR